MMPPMPRVAPFDRPATYDDLIALSDLFIAEIVNGELHGTRRLPPRASCASSALGYRILAAYDKRSRGPEGWVVLRSVEIHLGPDVVVPDWAAWRRSRVPTLEGLDYMSLAPDWVCEVLTPVTVAFDKAQKLPVYAREGVPYAWLLDTEAQMLDVRRLENSRWTILATHGGDEVVRVAPFDDIELDMGACWAD
jgi:Uma2 family endonuclease